ncbi:Tse2 family ADP-ribosyltransferase toxin [Dyella flagellata]|uniref:Tse2 ADP-ribosyltransferase toxin domain-containing protein n=1 Tax=Dyella flagellata TaxID=1867833 RepID=A0ABQ5XEX1_9GAMM|nr:hypothetical protein [Dyella flagellata]GLQ90236.1 hypothetical protein GCM10007898_38110 [Dyella flagellata]
METKVLKDILLEQGEIDRYYEGQVPTSLWRALNQRSGMALFDLIEEPFEMSNGRHRPPDITIVTRNKVQWVTVSDSPRGISTWDATGIPAGKDWSYYRIPAGTVLPEGLCIVRDHYNRKAGATHHTIAPARDMPLSHFKFLLNKLAENVIKEAA